MKPWLRPASAMFAIAWGGNEFTPLLVMYKQDHHLSTVTVDVLLFAYVLGIVPALLIGGPMSDRFGRRALLRPAPAIAMLGSLTLAFSQSLVPMLLLGRILSGIALGLGMAVGSSWVKELSGPPHDDAPEGAGAKRASMALTAGFGLGAGVAGVIAQWAPFPDQAPYLLNVLVCLPGLLLVRNTPETIRTTPGSRTTGLVDDLRIPAIGHRRFLLVVLPVAPWVFGTAACAYAVLPALMASHVSNAPVAFSALLCMAGLSCGFVVQSLGRRIDRPGSARAVQSALALVVIGMGVGALAVSELTVPLALLGSLVLGAGYGLSMVSGLLEIQRIAGPRDLAGLTAVFYSTTYLGFAAPAVMAGLATSFGIGYPTMLLTGLAVATACLALVTGVDARTADVTCRRTG